MPVISLKDQTVVIIGGTSGIGFAVAEGAVADGAKVVVASSSKAKVDAAVARLGATASGRVVDVADEDSIAAFFGAIGGFDHMVFTAGDIRHFAPAPITELDIAKAGDGLKLRFWGGLAAIKHGLPRMSANGSITFTDGMLAHKPRKGMPLVTAFAGATEHLIKGLAVDSAPIRVNAVCPGLVRTELLAAWPEAMIAQMTEGLPIPRGAEPAEAAQAYLYLMRGGYTTGQVMMVDGGAMLV